MPQKKRRSISYRSFVICDNPKGVVECGAIRKSKPSSSLQKKEHSNKVESDERQENQTPSSAIIKEEKKEMGIKGFTCELDTSTSFQLQQVSNRADTLSHVTNSWSNNGHTEDIARDFLKGVLDLQESLVILSKLQEASSCKSRRKQKQKQQLEEGRLDDMVNRLLDSNRFGYLHNEKKQLHMGFQSPRASVDEPARKSFDEVKSVVRESLLRGNVMRKLDSPNVPSTSSSKFALSDSSASLTAPHRIKKGKGSSLIVKLMGLEPLPSSPSYHKGKKVINLAKPVYDTESPRGRRSHFAAQEMGSKQRAFDEILESLNFKGLLRSNSAKGLTVNSLNYEDFPSVYERPPIVVMRPLRFWGEGAPENEKNLLKLSPRRGPPQETVRYSETVNFRNKFRGVIAKGNFEEKSLFSKFACTEEKVSTNLHEKLQKKKAALRRVTEDEEVTPIRRKGEEKKNIEKFDEQGTQDQRKLNRAKMKKQKDEEPFLMNQTSSHIKTFSTAILDYGIVKTSESSSQQKRNRQPVSIMQVARKENGGMAREEIDSTSENEYVFPTFDSMIIKNLNIERWNKNSRVMIPNYDKPEGIDYRNRDPKNSYHIASMAMHEDAGGQDPDDNQSLLSEITSTSISCSVAHPDENESPVSEVTLASTNEIGNTVHVVMNDEENPDHLKNCQPWEDSIEGQTDHETSTICLTLGAKLKAFLLSSPSFVIRAKELFNLQVNPASTPHTTDLGELDVASPRVLLDCAIELMELRGSQLSQVWLPPFLTTYPQNFPSLSRLLEEVCKEIEDLRCYLNLPNESLSSDQIYALLDRDLRFNTGMWEIGWKNFLSIDEVEQVIGEVDKYVLGKLIEEVLEDFLIKPIDCLSSSSHFIP